MQLTLDKINYIINNCKSDRVGYSNNEEDLSCWFIYFIDDKIFKGYNIINNINNSEDINSWSIRRNNDSTIEKDYYNALDNDLNSFLKQHENSIETNEEIIKLVTEFEGYSINAK